MWTPATRPLSARSPGRAAGRSLGFCCRTGARFTAARIFLPMTPWDVPDSAACSKPWPRRFGISAPKWKMPPRVLPRPWPTRKRFRAEAENSIPAWRGQAESIAASVRFAKRRIRPFAEIPAFRGDRSAARDVPILAAISGCWRWPPLRWRKWDRAAFTIRLPAGFIAIRWTSAGACRILRKCRMTIRNC